MKWKTMVWMAVTVSMAAVVLSVGYLQRGRRLDSGQREAIRVAYSPKEHSALFLIAEGRGFFADNGLDMATRNFDSGAAALGSVLKGEADLAIGTAEFPLVKSILQKEKVRVIGCIGNSETVYIVGRKDRHISSLSDLKGKRVGTVLGTISEFYLGVCLNLHGINMQDITLVDLKTAPEWVDAITEGRIDAVAMAQPQVNAITARLGENAVVWPAQNGQVLYSLIIGPAEWTARHPETVRRLLRALVQAEGYLAEHPAEAKAIVARRVQVEAAYQAEAWPLNQCSLALDQALIVTMEDQARWMIKNKLTEAKEVPNFLDYVSIEALMEVKPRAVSIIH